jgi:hypothetical protein
MVEIKSLDHYCPACRGACFIEIAQCYPVEVARREEGPKFIKPSYKKYPCPECQKVFYHSDLEDLNVVEPMRYEFKYKPEYVNHLKTGIARRLGQMMLGLINFRERDDPESQPYGYMGLHGRVFVIKQSAIKREFEK